MAVLAAARDDQEALMDGNGSLFTVGLAAALTRNRGINGDAARYAVIAPGNAFSRSTFPLATKQHIRYIEVFK